jgi:DME family drug/metabolite transporter
VIIGLVLGDTLYIKGMGIIGASKALPISITYPIFVLPFSATIIGESLSILTIGGVFITVMGLYLITAPQRGSERASGAMRKRHWWGVSLILAASLCWAVGTMSLRFAMVDLDPILAGAIRMPFMTLVLFAIVNFRRSAAKVWNHGLRSLTILALAGILGIGLGGLLFMVGVKNAGAARTAILSATAPLFGVPLSMLMLRERITLKIVLGTILCVVGIWFVI